MKRKYFLLVLLIVCVAVMGACGTSGENNNYSESLLEPLDVVFVEGGLFVNPVSNLYGMPVGVQDFYIGRFVVTQREWLDVMEENPSLFQYYDNPVERVSWYDAIVFLNRRSEMAGLEPFYNIDMENEDPNNLGMEDYVRWTVTINPGANGYRLPSELEWEYAASGGRLTQGYIFSGSDDPFEVGWSFRNSGDEFLEGMWHWPTLEANNGRPRPVGQKLPNELGIYDMSGNVREWVWNWHHVDDITPTSGQGRSVRGGGWVGSSDVGRIYFRDSLEAHFRFEDLGFRVARSRVD